MGKKLIIILMVLTVAIVVLVGILAWQNWGDISSKINPQKTFSCASKTDCVLAYTEMSACWPCDSANVSMKCVSPAEAKRLQQKRIKKYGKVMCEPCMKSIQEFTCVCQNGSCAKVAVNQIDINQPSANCVKEGEIYGTFPNPPESPSKQQKSCCPGLKGIETAIISEDGECHIGTEAVICANCGNGVCGKGENQCNCGNDCKADETTGWKTYRNEQYGFEVQYPSKYISSNREGYFPKNKVVATFTRDNNYFLDVAVFDGPIKDYRFEDQSAGGIFIFNSQNKEWTLSNGTILPEGLFEKIDTNNMEVYLYKTGDVLKSNKVIIVPNIAYPLVVEIVATTRATETANGLDYVATPSDFDIKEMLSTFKFIK